MKQLDTLGAITSPPPQLSAARVGRSVSEQYGLDGELKPLLGERDQNFRLTTADMDRYIVKIANLAEEKTTTDFQIQALLHIESKACRVAIPRVIRTRDGGFATNLSGDDSVHVLRVVSYVAGRPLEDIVPDVAPVQDLGANLAEIDIALSDFEHPGDSQALLWDMQRASELRSLMSYITDPQLQATVNTCLDDFDGVTPLEDVERSLVYDMVRMRLATTITLLYWRKSARPDDDAYMQAALQSEDRSARFLERINTLPREQFAERIRLACRR